MSHSVNKATLLGQAWSGSGDPGDQTWARRSRTSRLATHDRWRDQVSGDMREHTEWHRVAIFNENLAQDCRGPSQQRHARVYLEGQIQTRQWDDAHGKPRITTEIVLSGYQAQLTLA